MGRIFSGTRLALLLMGRGLNLMNRFEVGMNFFLNPGRVPVLPRPAPINFKIKFNLNFKINLI